METQILEKKKRLKRGNSELTVDSMTFKDDRRTLSWDTREGPFSTYVVSTSDIVIPVNGSPNSTVMV